MGAKFARGQVRIHLIKECMTYDKKLQRIFTIMTTNSHFRASLQLWVLLQATTPSFLLC